MATTGQKTGIGTTAVALTGTSTPVRSGTTIKALSTNMTSVYVGLSGVTAATGFELAAGGSVVISRAEAADASLIYVVAASGTPGVCFRAV